MPQPILRSERLLLVPLAARHLEHEVALDADPEVLRHLTGRARTRAEVTESHARRLADAAKVDGLGFWATFGTAGGCRGSTAPPAEADGEFLGLMMLPPAPGDPGSAELGYRFARRAWRQGLATEASLLLLRHAFDTTARTRVYARTMAVNLGSRGVMAAIGMRHVRTFHEHWDDPLPGAEKGEVEYEMTRPMWQARTG